ncbi:MAG: sugar phosphate isomerase/epimerase family protein [Candidatus Glassbacteria bacterium]
MKSITRRQLLKSAPAVIGALSVAELAAAQAVSPADSGKGPKVGLVTYMLAAEWDVPTIIANCTETKFAAVELRTTHAHGVEVSLSQVQRAEVRKKFEDSPVKLASLGSAFEYDSPDPAVLKQNIEGTKEYARLAADLGCDGIKVRPNNLQEKQGITKQQTITQIADSLTIVGRAAAGEGVEVRVEVHGGGTNRFPVYSAIMEQCQSPNVYVCWNCNDSDLEDGGLEHNFKLVADKIHFVHMRDLFVEEYPWRKLFELLAGTGYEGYCCAEIPASSDPLRVMKYYRALFLAYQNRL